MRLFVSAVVVLAASHAQAGSLGPIPGEERFTEGQQGKDPESSAGAQLGFSQIEEDYFLTITPQLDLNLGQFGAGLQVPLNLRVIDQKPKNEDDYGGIIRKEDWDEQGE